VFAILILYFHVRFGAYPSEAPHWTQDQGQASALLLNIKLGCNERSSLFQYGIKCGRKKLCSAVPGIEMKFKNMKSRFEVKQRS
jgi:hypothetical protein